LAGSLVFKSNGADVEFLERERIGQADVAVSVMESDEKNLLSSLLLKQLGVRKVIARVENPPYVKLFEIVGVDVAINPRTVTKEEIIKYTMRLHAESITLIESGMAEVLEVEASSGKAIGVPLSKANFPKGSIVGAIVRGEQVIIPRGKDMIKPGDKVIIFAEESKLKEVEKLL
jgi:trk system potassium uptake protein TrkA